MYNNGNTSKNINFGLATSGVGTPTSGAFDDYEEGTWTPTVTQCDCTIADEAYTKIGDVVFVSCTVTINAITGTGDIKIGGFPFTFKEAGNIPIGANSVFDNRSDTAGNPVFVMPYAGTNGPAACVQQKNSSAYEWLQDHEISTGWFKISATYIAN
jgi:hypothetical protein